jgi:hypothetical protein
MNVAGVSPQSVLTDEQSLRYRRARKAAEQFVAQTFFSPIFKQMRASPFKSELLGGGRGGEVFSSMLDGVLAERMGRGVGGELVDALLAKLEPHVHRRVLQAERGRTNQTR